MAAGVTRVLNVCGAQQEGGLGAEEARILEERERTAAAAERAQRGGGAETAREAAPEKGSQESDEVRGRGTGISSSSSGGRRQDGGGTEAGQAGRGRRVKTPIPD